MAKINEELVVDLNNRIVGFNNRLKTLEDNLQSHLGAIKCLKSDTEFNNERIKTLEDKVKFIMENGSTKMPHKRKVMVSEDSYTEINSYNLQDLWDEEKPRYSGLICKEDGSCEQISSEPTVKECDYTWCQCNCHKINYPKNNGHICKCEPTDKSEKIEEIISEFDKEFPNGLFRFKEYKETLKSWLRDKLNEI